MSDLDKWIEVAKQCKYLPENDLKQLCDIVCDYLIEESNVHPVQLPGMFLVSLNNLNYLKFLK